MTSMAKKKTNNIIIMAAIVAALIGIFIVINVINKEEAIETEGAGKPGRKLS